MAAFIEDEWRLPRRRREVERRVGPNFIAHLPPAWLRADIVVSARNDPSRPANGSGAQTFEEGTEKEASREG